MTQRIDTAAVAPRGEAAMEALEAYVEGCGLDHALLELVKMRVSQINGCAYCLAMHGRLARRHGVPEAKLDTLAAWRESPAFDEREKAALAWSEAVTDIAMGVPDEVYTLVRRAFAEKEIVDLTWAVIAINGWNRTMVAFRVPPEVG
ncbi:MAG: carboxymuconolactone decarboxylase family protein [Alphaproteobacteria bacterium]